MSTSMTRASSRLLSCALSRPGSLPGLTWPRCDAGHGRKYRRARTWLVALSPFSLLPTRFYSVTPAAVGSEALQRALARIGDLEQRIELGELEQRLEVVVQVRETKLSALLSNLLR